MWLDPDLDARNGILMAEESDMLRLDSMIMMVQLGIRQLLEVRPLLCLALGSAKACSPPYYRPLLSVVKRTSHTRIPATLGSLGGG